MRPDDPRPLPSGWRWVKLGEVCEHPTETRDPRKTPRAEFRYVDISSVDNRLKRITSATPLMGADAPSRARQVIRTGDVLVATTRPNLNAIAVVPAELDGQVCSTGFCVLRPTAAVETDWLFAHVRTSDFVTALSGFVKGALYPGVSDKQVFEQPLPLPPLSEQRRIAGILKQQMAEVDKARKATEAQLEAARALPAAYVREVFDSEEAKKWPRKKLRDVLNLRNEVVHPYENPKGPATFVGLEHIEAHTGERTGSLPVEMSELTGRKPRFYTGDIVYGYLRPYLNKVWIAEFDGLCSVDQYVYALDSRRAATEFVAAYLRSSVYLERAPTSVSPGQLPRIRKEEVASTEIGLPGLDIQKRVLRAMRDVNREHTASQKALTAQLETINRLPAALLRKAFAGEV